MCAELLLVLLYNPLNFCETHHVSCFVPDLSSLHLLYFFPMSCWCFISFIALGKPAFYFISFQNWCSVLLSFSSSLYYFILSITFSSFTCLFLVS